MNQLIKIAIKAAAIGAASIGVAAAVDKFKPLKNTDGTPLVLNPIGSLEPKKIGLFAGIIAIGGIVVYFAAKLLKINFLKS